MADTDDLKNAMNMLSDGIAKTTELFYTQKEAEGYLAFGELLTPLMNILDSLIIQQNTTGKPEFDQQELLRILSEAMQAIEARDAILLADILQYDILDKLEEISAQL